MYQLDSIAEQEEGIELSLTLDGAKFTNHITHVTCSIKVVDVRARDPINKNLLINVQSRDLSFVFKCHLMKDTKEGYKFFNNFFYCGKTLIEVGLPECKVRKKVRLLKITIPTDLSTT